MKRKLIHFFSIVSVFLIFGAVIYLWQSSSSNTQTDDQSPNKNQKTNNDENGIPKPHIDTELQQKISAWADDQPGSFGIAIREVDGDMRIANYSAGEQFVAASTYKLFVSYAALRSVEQGDFTLQTRTSDGRTVSVCIEAMLVRSDNDCGWPVGSLVDWNKIDSLLRNEGFTSTQINNYTPNGEFTDTDKLTSATDLTEFLYRLQVGKLLNTQYTELMLSHMKQQIWDERIEAGVPVGIPVAAKPGWLPGVENDAAIVYGPKSTYVVTILSTNSSPTTLAELSETIYNHLQQ